MKKTKFILLFFAALCAFSFTRPSDERTEAVGKVKEYYANLKTIFNSKNAADDKAFIDAQKNIKNIMKQKEGNMPTDGFIELNKNVILKTYINAYHSDKISSFSFSQPRDVKIIEAPDFINNRFAQFVIMFVDKTVNGKSFTDKVSVEIKGMTINSVSNKTTINVYEDPDYMAISAAEDFTNNDYISAYKKYLKVLEKTDKRKYDAVWGDTYYRLAVMTYQGWGCSDLSKKTRMLKTDEYLDEAIKWGDQEINVKAKRMCQRVNGKKCFTNNL
mgnify:CR=1 FL=1